MRQAKKTLLSTLKIQNWNSFEEKNLSGFQIMNVAWPVL